MTEASAAVVVALIAAITALYGYTSERRKERESDLATVRFKIYADFIAHLTQFQSVFREVQRDPACPNCNENPAAFFEFAITKYPKFETFMQKWQRTNALLCIYGADGAVKAAASYHQQNADFRKDKVAGPADAGAMILELRKHLFAPESSIKDSLVTTEEINSIINS